ncbi:MAG: type II secretion system protein [Chloroflexi bacterium]|nr:type II secretion system protein [Chloroflexota bacterium]
MKMWSLFKRPGKGFTLVELMVVMAIMGVLAAIVVPAVSGTKQVSQDSQVKNDGSTVQNGVSAYYGDQTSAETLTTTTGSVLGTNNATMIVSTKWPEQNMTTAYPRVFPASGITVTLQETDGSSAAASAAAFAGAYNAIDFGNESAGLLGPKGYIPALPDGADAAATTTGTSGSGYNNYLWVLKKIPAGSDATAGRTVQVFRLTKVEAGTTPALTYQRVF